MLSWLKDWSGVKFVGHSIGIGEHSYSYMSYSLNSLKGGYIGDYIGDYYRGY